MINKLVKFSTALVVVAGLNLNAANLVSEPQCTDKGEEYIFAGGECIQFYESEGDKENELNIIVHGTL